MKTAGTLLVGRETLRAFALASTSEEERARLDEHTWDDLDMDAVRERLDRTVSLPGRLALHRMLCTPGPPPAVLSERQRLIELFEGDPELSGSLRRELVRLDRRVNADELVQLLWGDPPEQLPFRRAYPLLAAAAVVTVALTFAVGKLWLLAMVVVLALNSAIYFWTRTRWQRELEALRFLAALLAAARRVSRLDAPGLAEHRQWLADAVRRTAPLARRIAWVSSSGPRDLLYDYVNMLFLLELQAYGRIAVRLPPLRPLLREVFVRLGELDALRGVAEWRAERPGWCRPELEDGKTDDGGGKARLEIEDGTHPLLDDAVPSSIVLGSRGALVTGANMSGKSTFLRVLGINAVLAQSIVTCTARRFRSSRLRVLSSMRAADDVTRGKSHYLAEAQRLQALVQLAGAEPTLCLIDELLSGTNAEERLAASAAILEHLVLQGALVAAATHDLELAEQLRGAFDSYCFADDVADGALRFEHRIHAGVATRRNAILLLEHLGYPRSLVDRARARLA